VVPFSFHLLALRRETPSAGGTAAGVLPGEKKVGDSDAHSSPRSVDDESQQRVLRKRLKWLFEPLVQSLGDSADNISFLLRMAEIIGKEYMPVDAFPGHISTASSPPRLSISSQTSTDFQPVGDTRCEMLEAKLKTICVAAREVLLSFVKKDVNLTTYPGIIHLSPALFKKSTGAPALRMSQQSIQSLQSSPFGSRRAILKYPKVNKGTLSDRLARVDRPGPGLNPEGYSSDTK
jgi:hypothetical protein